MYKKAHWWVLGISLLIISGFLPTYILNIDQIATRAHWHFWTCVLWMAYLFCQAYFAANKKMHYHKLLGWSSVIIFTLMIGVGYYTVWYSSNAALSGAPELFSKLYLFDVLFLTTSVCFYVLAIVNRKKVQIHQRLMLFTLVALAPPGYGRAMFFYILGPMGLPFSAIYHPMMLMMVLFIGVMAFKENWKYWPTNLTFGLLVGFYIVSFWVPEFTWWFEFWKEYGLPADEYEKMLPNM